MVFLRRPYLRRCPLRLRKDRENVSCRIRIFLFVGRRHVVVLFNGRIIILPIAFLSVHLFVSIMMKRQGFRALALRRVVKDGVVSRVIREFIDLCELQVFQRFVRIS